MEHTITIKRQSEDWMTDDNHWMEKCPRYDLDDGKLIENMESWAVSTVLDTIQRDLSRQLLKLFYRSKSYYITDGYFEVLHKVEHGWNHVVVELSFTMTSDSP